jgi:hypothetical protein
VSHAVGAQQRTAEEVRAAVDEVYARPEFSDDSSWFSELLEWLQGLFGEGSGEAAVDLGWVVLWLLVVILAGLAGWAFVRLGGRLPDGPARRGSATSRVSRRVSELLGRARKAREQGDLVLALRLTFFALVVGLGRRGDLEYRDAWTNRELLARGHPSADVSARLGPLVDELDLKMFGEEETTEGDLERLDELCRRWLAPSTVGGEERRSA